jgi:hypothetical protein
MTPDNEDMRERDVYSDRSGHEHREGDSSRPGEAGSDPLGPGEASLQLPRRFRYSCTRQELEEAQELALIEAHGGGSKWGTIAFTVILLGLAFITLFWRVAPLYRLPLAVAIVVGTVLLIVCRKLVTRGGEDAPIEVEISEAGLRFGDGESSSMIVFVLFWQPMR